MNWKLIGIIAFWVAIAVGLVVMVGEAIVAGLSKDSVMEGRDDVAPEYHHPLPERMPPDNYLQVPPFLPQLHLEEVTEPIEPPCPECLGYGWTVHPDRPCSCRLDHTQPMVMPVARTWKSNGDRTSTPQ